MAQGVNEVLAGRGSVQPYNYEHFPVTLMYEDLARSFVDPVPVGSRAPDFSLTSTDGRTLALHDLRGRPVVLHFGSLT